MKVTVGLSQAPVISTFAKPVENAAPEVAWEERPKVELEVSEEDTLLDIVGRAAEELRVEVAPEFAEHSADVRDQVQFFAFQPEGDRTGIRAGMSYVTPLVAEDGTPYWNQDWKTAKYGEVRRAVERDVIPNRDPDRLYLILNAGEGNGFGIDWPQIVETFLIARGLLGGMSDIEGSVQFLQRVRGRLGRAEPAASETFVEFQTRGAPAPHDLAETLDDKAWLPADLAETLQVTEERAIGLLEGFGFALADSGLYRLKADPEAEFIYNLHEETEIGNLPSGDGLPPAARIRDRLRHLVETGERAELPEGFGQPTLHDLTEEEAIRHVRASAKEAEASMAEIDEGEPGQSAQDLDPEMFPEEGPGAGLPDVDLDLLILRCGCGEGACEARMEFAGKNGKLRLKTEDVGDHFVINASMMLSIAVAAEVPPEDI